MIEVLSKLSYTTELLLAQLIFLYAFPKRKHFLLRYIGVFLLNVALWYLVYDKITLFGYRYIYFFFMLLKIVLSIFSMIFCFQASPWVVVSACVGGVALQHIGYQLSLLISLLPFLPRWNVCIEIITCLVLYGIAFFLIGRPLKRSRYFEHYDKRMIILSAVIVFICIGIIRLYRPSGTPDLVGVAVILYAVICNALALFVQFFWVSLTALKSNYLVLKRIHDEEVKQYENSKANAKLINLKCHDLKHKLLSLEHALPKEEIESMQKMIDDYDNTYKTGLDVLDVILNEKNIFCRAKGISLTCMGDGSGLSFMNTMDLYSLFGNILENAIEAVKDFTEREKKIISITIEKKGGYVLINAINFLEKQLTFVDGLPVTTKKGEAGYHGYGLKSIQDIAQKYHGNLAIDVTDGVFSLSVYMLN